MATMHFESFMPAKCCMAPEMPHSNVEVWSYNLSCLSHLEQHNICHLLQRHRTKSQELGFRLL